MSTDTGRTKIWCIQTKRMRSNNLLNIQGVLFNTVKPNVKKEIITFLLEKLRLVLGLHYLLHPVRGVKLIWFSIFIFFYKCISIQSFFVLVYYYNFAWRDYGDATLSELLNMIKVVAFAITEGRVAVHCHAGN